MKLRASQRNFGVEIECYLPVECAQRSGSHLGTGNQIDWAPDGWGGKRDGSLTSRYAGFRAIEVISPILQGLDGLAEVAYVVDQINEFGGKVDYTCGLHVHVDARDLSHDQIQAVRAAFIRYEKAFYGINGQRFIDRWESVFAKNSDNWRSDDGDRYRSLNMTNLAPGGHGTLEIRVWAGTLDTEKVVTAVQMAVALVCKAASEGAEPAERIDDVTEAITAFMSEHFNTKVYRIVPSCTVRELAQVMLREARAC